MKKTYENIEIILTNLKYDEHGWKVYVNIKVLNVFHGEQSGYKKFPCLFQKS